jgi:hypothetical protein
MNKKSFQLQTFANNPGGLNEYVCQSDGFFGSVGSPPVLNNSFSCAGRSIQSVVSISNVDRDIRSFQEPAIKITTQFEILG